MSIKMKVIEYKAWPGHYVVGLDEETQSVMQMTKDKAMAKKFPSENHAFAYMNKHTNCGYGFNATDCAVVDA